MKTDQEIMNSIRAAIDDCTRGIDEAPSLHYQIARKAKGEEPVVKKLSTSAILVIALVINSSDSLSDLWPANWRRIRVGTADFQK